MKNKVSNDDGNINIDFLVGLLVFMMAFLYVIVTIPGIFLPYQTNSVDLRSVVYRTSSLLAEDPGWWSNKTFAGAIEPYNGTDWENGVHLPYLARIGLADNKLSPNLLSIKKISTLKGLSYDYIRANLSLGDVNDPTKNTVMYNFTLTITLSNATGAHYNLLTVPAATDPVTEIVTYSRASANIIESIDRVVMIDEGDMVDMGDVSSTAALPNSYHLDVNGSNVSLSGFGDKTNITVRMSRFNVQPFDDYGNFSNFKFTFYHNADFAVDASNNILTADECFTYGILNVHVRNQTSDYWLSSVNDLYYPDSNNIIDLVLNGTRVAELYYHYDLADPAMYDYVNKFYCFRINTENEPLHASPVAYFPETLPGGSDNLDYSDNIPNNDYYKHSFSTGMMTLQVWQA
ncbi:MAG TPA: hypothetical protein VGJ92_13045 [Methanocella sp.]